MKRFLIFAASVVVSFFVVAQQNTSIEIDPSSFKPVQTNAISGVAIDKIQPDLSRRPCARIKMHINRMSREDIASLSVKTVGGNVVVMKSVVASEGNGLIIELTAKPQTRFYLHHDKYGDSNEVVLDLEGEKEYKLEAELSLLQSIVVSTNVVGADVYIDNDFKGQTGSGMALTVNDMTHGIHNLRVSYGVAKSERQIEVSGSNIHFRIDVDSSLSRPQYVVFVVQPKSASVVIEGKTLLPDADGVVTTVLNSGSYNYLVTAKEHHDEKGTFVVSGSKVQKSVTLRPAYGWLSVPSKGVLVGASVFVDNGFVGQTPIAEHKLSSGTHRVRVVKEMYRAHEEDIVVEDNKRVEYAPTLVADFASVTVDAGGSYDIYVNNELKGESPWSGNLATGAYIFEARKAGHRTTSLSKTISATPAQQRYTLPAPTPIVGTLNVTSIPAMAEVYVDGTKAGETPLMQDFIVGTHKISIRKAGYYPAEQSVTIEEGKMARVAMQMNKEVVLKTKIDDVTIALDLLSNTRDIDNVIIYTSSDNTVVNPDINAFGAKIVSNEYDVKNRCWVIKFNEPINYIGTRAFKDCKKLTSIIIPASVVEIEDYAFYRCTSMTKVSIGGSTKSIGDYAFAGCASLTDITIPDSVISIGKSAFASCKNITSVTIGKGLNSIGLSAFYGCNNLSAFYGDYASFDNRCLVIDGKLVAFAPFNLTYCIIPDNVSSIQEGVFRGSTMLKGFNSKFASTDNRCLIVDGEIVAFAQAGLTEYSIPEAALAIGHRAFANCKDLVSVIISDNVISIGKSAFSVCDNLTNVIVGKNVTSIGQYAFSSCKKLSSVYMKSNTPPMISRGIFSYYDVIERQSMPIGCKIYVPRKSTKEYKEAEKWREYASHIEDYDDRKQIILNKGTAVEEENIEDDQPFVKVEQMPSFMGGDLMTFRNWVQSKVRFPQIAQENGISGRVLLMFVIERDGTLTNIQVLQTPDSSLSDEAIRVLKTSPKWTPGKQRNQSVRVKYTMPIDFRITN